VSGPFVTQVGEGFAGSGVATAHVNTVLGTKGGPVAGAWAAALAHPSAGHTPFVVVAQPGVAVKPATVFVNKATIASDAHATLTWGPAQAGVAAGVVDAVAAGHVDRARADDLLLLAAVWVDPAAGPDDTDAVFANNRTATFGALAGGAQRLPAWDDVERAAGDPWNPYFRAR
jgi:5,6,7,8-tetrahydromethanopterin hydro-lyase